MFICALAAPASSLARPSLLRAGRAARTADSAFVARARSLAACRRQAGASCATQRARLQSAGVRLKRANARFAAVARMRAASRPSRRQSSPRLTLRHQTLHWGKVAGVRSYVLVRRAAGRGDVYLVVTGTSSTPPALPGKKVSYAVRTAVVGSRWSRSRTISYKVRRPTVTTVPIPVTTTPAPAPADTTTTTPAPAPTPTTPAPAPTTTTTTTTTPPPPVTGPKPTDAPVLSVDGLTLRWTPVASVSSYLLVTKVPGRADAYTTVSGTSTTPTAVPGSTVAYSVRTAVDGSAWATERSISFPAAPAPSPTPTPTPTPAPAPSFTAGINAGSALLWELPFIQNLGAHSARLTFDIGTPTSTMAPIIDAYAKAGIQALLMADFFGSTPTTAQAATLRSWAAAFGPGGTFWAGKGYPDSLAVRHIEFGNETNQSWQYPAIASDPNWANTTFYRDLATGYALAFKAGSLAVRDGNGGVDLLTMADTPGNWPSWFNAVYAAVPDFDRYVGGWVMHSYGPSPQTSIDKALAMVASHGAPSSIPFFITEIGIASDNGPCLSDNYGWNKCMTYADAASAFTSTLSGLRSRYGSRLAGIWAYQAHDQKSSGSSTDREGFFGAVTLQNTAKGAYTTAVRSFLSNG